MRLQNPTREYHPTDGRGRAYLLLHGIGDGIDAPYTRELSGALIERGQAVLALQFPYMDRGDGYTSGPSLLEETHALHEAWEFLRSEQYSHITVIAKSLGGIVVSHWLDRTAGIDGIDVNIMGYVLAENGVITGALRGRLNSVIQGEHDRFGGAAAVRTELAAQGVGGRVVEIASADHSFRDPADPKDKLPAYQGQAIGEVLDRVLLEWPDRN